MTALRHLQKAFPRYSSHIIALRDDDPTFDEVCRDFEEIASALHLVLGNRPPIDSGYMSDLRATRNGLHREIDNYLKTHNHDYGDTQ